MKKNYIRLFYIDERYIYSKPKHCDLKENFRCIKYHLKRNSDLYIIKIL